MSPEVRCKETMRIIKADAGDIPAAALQRIAVQVQALCDSIHRLERRAMNLNKRDHRDRVKSREEVRA